MVHLGGRQARHFRRYQRILHPHLDRVPASEQRCSRRAPGGAAAQKSGHRIPSTATRPRLGVRIVAGLSTARWP